MTEAEAMYHASKDIMEDLESQNISVKGAGDTWHVSTQYLCTSENRKLNRQVGIHGGINRGQHNMTRSNAFKPGNKLWKLNTHNLKQ